MKISILTQPHSLQRYNTIGDWYTSKTTGQVHIHVSELGDWRYHLLIAVHELVEAFLCLHDGVAEESVDKFDKEFIQRDTEPGDAPNSPYQKQHCLATWRRAYLGSLSRSKVARIRRCYRKAKSSSEKERP